MIAEGRLGLKTGSGFYDYAGRDLAAYRARRAGTHARHAAPRRPVAAAGRVDAGLTRARPMASIRRAFADLSIGQVHFASCGDAAAPAVLLLHQTPRSWTEYRAVLPLIGQRWRAIALDTPGFGDSAPLPGPARIEAWAAVAVELLDALSIARAHVVGHHTGGVIALEIAAAAPARVISLVLSSTPFTGAGACGARGASARRSTRSSRRPTAATWRRCGSGASRSTRRDGPSCSKPSFATRSRCRATSRPATARWPRTAWKTASAASASRP